MSISTQTIHDHLPEKHPHKHRTKRKFKRSHLGFLVGLVALASFGLAVFADGSVDCTPISNGCAWKGNYGTPVTNSGTSILPNGELLSSASATQYGTAHLAGGGATPTQPYVLWLNMVHSIPSTAHTATVNVTLNTVGAFNGSGKGAVFATIGWQGLTGCGNASPASFIPSGANTVTATTTTTCMNPGIHPVTVGLKLAGWSDQVTATDQSAFNILAQVQSVELTWQ